MLTLKSLTFSGIGRFVDEQTIDFIQLGSLVQIDGQNNNTGGSSGAGKSTIPKALEFLLGLNDVSNSILQSRLTKESLTVTGSFELDGQPLKIERGKKLLIDLNGEVTTGSSKLTEEKLDQIIGMPRDLFRKILHKRQGEGGFFLDMGPSDIHKFLTSCLGLAQEQSKIVTLDTRLEILEKHRNVYYNGAESNGTALQATEEAILALGAAPALEINPGAAETLKTEHMRLSELHGMIKASQKTEIDDLEKSKPKIETIPFDRSKINQIQTELNTILAEVSKLEKLEYERQNLAKAKVSEIQLEISRLNGVEKNRQYEAERRASDIRFEKSSALLEVSVGETAKQDGLILSEELKNLRLSMCPKCKQSWVTEAAKTEEQMLVEKIQGLKKSVIAGIEASKRVVTYDQQLEAVKLECVPRPIAGLEALNHEMRQNKLDSEPIAILEAIELKLQADFKNTELGVIRQEERDHQVKENAKTQDALNVFSQRQEVLRKKHEFAAQESQQSVDGAREKLRLVENHIKNYTEAKKRFEDSINRLNEQKLIYSSKVQAEKTNLAEVEEEIGLATESKKAIKSYLSCSFEDALESIGDMATRFIRSIPNMQTATIQFEGLKETKEGKIKEEVTCMLSMDGEIGVPIKSLSGGERSSTDLAIDLAVIKFIEERTGKGIDVFILDEPFTGLDSQNILEALEMLKESSLDKRLLIVDHNPVASQSIEDRLTVVRDGLTSKIVQQ